MFVPTIAIPDPEDARIVFDALNAYYQSLPTGEQRERAIVLLMTAHAEIHRTTDTESGH